MLSLLASPDYGWAPKAEYTVYVMPLGTVESHPKACQRHDYDDMAWLVNKALDDGADLISIQVGGPVGYSLGYAFARAALQGVPVLIGAGNEHNTQLLTAGLNTTVAVGAVDRNRELAPFSNYGTEMCIRDSSEGLWQLRDDLKTMQERLGSYVTGVREAIKAFDAADGDAAAQQALSQAQLEQQQREVAVAPVTPQQAV